MPRPRKTEAIDYTQAHPLSAGLLERATCPDGVAFVLVRDATYTGLRLRVTAAGGKFWQFEARIAGKLFTRSLGAWPAVSIGAAQKSAGKLRAITGEKKDPRELERQAAAEAARVAAEDAAQAAAAAAQAVIAAAAAAAQALTVGHVWPLYLANGRPKRKDAWKPGYRADLEAMAAQGGVPKKRGQGLTRPGPLFPLLAMALADVNEDTLKSWFDQEALAGKHQAARALMMFRGFLRWCSARPAYRKLTDRDAGRAAAILENLPPNTKRTDALEAAQVPGWWAGVEQLSNRTASAYLRAMLVTGARREELAGLTWDNVDFPWRKLTIADKVDSTRVIPLTPYLAQLLATLPRVGPFVFASASKTGRLSDTRTSHAKALQSASIEGLTIHGLRRSFSLLGEAAGAPAGAIAQIMGHKPSATAEGYRPRSVDALRPFAELIEAHVLALAGVTFDCAVEPGKLRVVAG
jgi:integrase